MSSLPEVEVLLATFNGERFLGEQLDSIFAQDYGNIRVVARDDGSSDRTADILDQYARRFPGRLRVMPAGPPTGSPKRNFLLLMKACTASYICFADQDDVWLPDKVSRSKQRMDELDSRWGPNVPLLVYTDLRLVDDKLQTLHESFWAYMGIDPHRIDSHALLMVQGVVTGCTAMLNRRLLELSLRMSEDAYMHDGWISWLAAFMGRSGILEDQTVLYRQHDRNAVGTGTALFGNPVVSPTRSLWAKIRHPRIAAAHLTRWEVCQRQARAFLKEYGAELPAKDRVLLRDFVRCQTSGNRFVRILCLVRHGFYYVGLKPNVAMMIHLWNMRVDEHRPA